MLHRISWICVENDPRASPSRRAGIRRSDSRFVVGFSNAQGVDHDAASAKRLSVIHKVDFGADR
jgi:hypothetical protein